ncbi:MAG: metallophosphoesterase [Gemmataceae bacterium]|nr:metallophosphoesterase [Gemmataceae bacterium]
MVYVLNEWLLTPFRLAVHLPTATAVIADVHLGYREARRAAGDAVPVRPIGEQLLPVRQARREYPFRRLAVAGDLFERRAQTGWFHEFLEELAALEVTFAGLVPGNHDRGWQKLAALGPMLPDGLLLGNWRVVHGDVDLQVSPCVVMGHWHPVARHAGRRVRCYVVGPQLLVLPAFSEDAAGGDVTRSPRWRSSHWYAIIDNDVRRLNQSSLVPRRARR